MIGCKSACDEFATPHYCCTGAYGSPSTCPATQYSNAFKAACPTAHSYAYDDATSTFTCKGANYAITFCPTGMLSFFLAAFLLDYLHFLYECPSSNYVNSIGSIIFMCRVYSFALVSLYSCVEYIDCIGCIAGSPPTKKGTNSTTSSPPPPSPYSISQYGTGGGVRRTPCELYILLLCAAAFFALHSKSDFTICHFVSGSALLE